MRRSRWTLGALVAFLLPYSAFGGGPNLTVTNTNDSGMGSLRQAITDANNIAGPDTITFAIPGAGPHTIQPLTAYPIITQPVVIDGYTQPGSSPNTNPVGQGLNTVLKIEIDGSLQAAPPNHCLRLDTGGSTIRGLVINRCSTGDINFLSGPHAGNKVEGNFFETNVAGTILYEQSLAEAVAVGGGGQTNMTVGGTTPAARNLFGTCQNGVSAGGNVSGLVIQGNLFGLQISGTALLAGCTGSTRFAIFGNDGVSNFTIGGPGPGAPNVIAGVNNGITLRGGGHVVQGNLLGTDVTGNVELGLRNFGIDLYSASVNCIIGGSGNGEGNLIAGATNNGINVGGSGHIIHGNFIGTDPTGTKNFGNGRVGIQVSALTNSNTQIGGLGPGEANIIAFNGGLQTRSGGIGMSNGTRVTMRGNLIYDNLPEPGGGGGLAIDLNNDPAGVTRNDIGDADTGDNNLQNFPNIATAMPEAFANGGAGGTRVTGSLNSTASTTFDLDFYSSACARFPQDLIQAETFLGNFQVTTNASGVATFNQLLPVQIPVGALVTATATDPLGNTSEMSQRIVLSSGPPYGDPAGGQTLFLQGMQFEPGSTATVGGASAAVITIAANGNSMNITAPALPPGVAHGITVTTPSAVSGTLPNGWITRFTDTPQGHFASDWVAKLVKNGLTAGCGGGNFCVNSPVTREQMAVFLLRGKEGLCYVPVACTIPAFADVPCTSIYSRWINELVARQITAGCGGGNYCPGDAVTRQSMAVFLLVTLEGFGYAPPACTVATFGDVPCSHPLSAWIYDLVARNITAGCGGGNYCPLSSVTRGSMAVFLNVTFSLPL